MSDIAMCADKHCTNYSTCYRAKAVPSERQPFFALSPREGTECHLYAPMNYTDGASALKEHQQGDQWKSCHKIEKPCRVGTWNFGVGNSCRRVIEEAQRQYMVPNFYRQPLTDEQIDKIANGMPGGPEGFLKGWGWRQFARAIIAEYEGATQPPKDEPAPGEIS